MNNFSRVKSACYTTNVTMSAVCNLSPILFLTFRSLYGISYSLLGLLVLLNFVPQLLIDLTFSFFSHKFDINKTVKATPIIAIIGFVVYAFAPILFPDNVYLGLVIGTIIFATSSGLAEVLISPTIAAIPSDNPDREMSKLHSIYAWGVVGVIIYSTLFLFIFGQKNWQWLALSLALIPLLAFILFSKTELPKMETPEKVSGALAFMKNKMLWLCFLAIFLGGASECTMNQWASSYIEQALGLPKIWGDIFGVALFGLTLGVGRTWYSKYGKNIEKILFLGAIGATVCYLTASITNFAILGLIACALTGFCVSMLWPGSLIVASEKFPTSGVFIYAVMAAGGDLGASIGPQIIGIITDSIIANPSSINLASSLNLSVEQLAMKSGMLIGMIFPMLAIFIYFLLIKSKRKSKTNLLNKLEN